MTSLPDRLASAATGAAGGVVILSANPIHDTGGGQRSAQLALELLERDFCVLFVSHGKVTETVDLRLEYPHERLVEAGLRAVTSPDGLAALDRLVGRLDTTVVTQVPVRSWERVLHRTDRPGTVTVYDCIDRWDSELGRGWYRRSVERRIASLSDVLVSSAPDLVHHLELLAEREAHLLPNAFNGRLFRQGTAYERPRDLPDAGRIALYVGALWGGWLDWDLVGRCATEIGGTTFVFVGDHRGEGRGLPDNCVFLGLKPQTALPAYLAHSDLAFLPWRANDVTQATSPLKVYEFVAMALPVVAPDLETLRGIPGVALAGDDARFVDALRDGGRSALAPETRTAMERFAAANSWVQRVDALLELALDARRASGPASPTPPAGGVVPLTSAPADVLPGRAARARRSTSASRGSWISAPRGSSISVVIPAYNHERFVGQAVDSVLVQSLAAGDVVVVDDGSSDGTPRVLAERAVAGMRVIRQGNRGAHAAINRAVALSSGDWIAVLNSDDAFGPERLEHAWGVARTTGAALLIGSVRLIDEAGAPLEEAHDTARWYREARAEPHRSRSLRRALLRHNFAVTTSNFFFHRELWRRLGGFAAYRYVHDYDFLLRALELCPERVRYEPEMDDVMYRVHGGNTITEDVRTALGERARLLRALRRPLPRLRRALTRVRDANGVRHALASSGSLAPVPSAFGEEANVRLSGDGRAGAARLPRESGTGAVRPSRTPADILTVGLVVPSLDRGGLEEIVSLLAQALPARGIRPHVLCTHRGGGIADRLLAAGLPVTVARGRQAEWRAWAEALRPHVVSTHFAPARVIDELHALGVPLVETVHNTYAWFTPDDWAREARKAERLSAIIAVSDTVARYYRRHCAGAPAPEVVPNAVQPGRAAAVPRGFARRALDLDPNDPVLIHPGRLTVQKNLGGLLESFSVVVATVPEARLVLAGPTHDRRYVRSLERTYRHLVRGGSLRILPPVPHVGTLLSAADAFVSNSFYEGWSVAASEAAWVGLPLVLSDCGGSRELVGHGGERGHVVPNPLGDPLAVTAEAVARRDPDALAANHAALVEAMLDVIAARSAWAERRGEIRAYARRELAPERMAGAYARVLRRVVGRSPG